MALTAEKEIANIKDLLEKLSEAESATLIQKLQHVLDETIEHPDAAKSLLTRFNEECETQEQEDERQRYFYCNDLQSPLKLICHSLLLKLPHPITSTNHPSGSSKKKDLNSVRK